MLNTTPAGFQVQRLEAWWVDPGSKTSYQEFTQEWQELKSFAIALVYQSSLLKPVYPSIDFLGMKENE